VSFFSLLIRHSSYIRKTIFLESIYSLVTVNFFLKVGTSRVIVKATK